MCHIDTQYSKERHRKIDLDCQPGEGFLEKVALKSRQRRSLDPEEEGKGAKL
jgi:hypothetical protein